MRAIILLLVLLSWGSSLAQAAACPMAGPAAAGSMASAHGGMHHPAPAGEHHGAPARSVPECAVGMPCVVPALGPTDPGLPRPTLAAAPETVRPVRAYASPDLAAEPPPPRHAPRF